MLESYGQQIGGRDSNSRFTVLTLVHCPHIGPPCPGDKIAIGYRVKLIPFMTSRKGTP